MRISLVIPVYNEQETIKLFLEETVKIFEKIPKHEPEFIFVNDGSSDNTLNVIISHIEVASFNIRVLDLSRNFGKEAALSAGIEAASGEAVIPMDVDLQDPPELIIEMIKKWEEGYEVVLAKRSSRATDSVLKRVSANLFYRIHNLLSESDIPSNVGDFRLMDKVVVEQLCLLPESRRFMKGLFAWVGFKTATLEYERPSRSAGESKFNGWKLWNFAIEGFTSFSTVPLRVWTYFGFLVSFLSISYACFILIRVLLYGVDVPGYASLIVTTSLLGGLQLIGIGVIGEYLGRTYIESKRRPVYIVRKIYSTDEATDGP